MTLGEPYFHTCHPWRRTLESAYHVTELVCRFREQACAAHPTYALYTLSAGDLSTILPRPLRAQFFRDVFRYPSEHHG